MRLPARWTARLLAGALATTGVALPLSAAVAPVAAAAASCPSPGGVKIPEATAPVGSEVSFSGHGLGHSLGMSQYGAQGAARLGCSHAKILSTYYNGSVLTGKTMPTEMRNWMLVDGTHVVVAAETGNITWKLAGCAIACPPVQPKNSTWRVRTDAAKATLELVNQATNTSVWKGGSRSSTLIATAGGKVIGLRSWRGNEFYLDRRVRFDDVRFTVNASGLDAVQTIRAGYVAELGRVVTAMDKYLWGVAEVPISWTRDAHEALRAQAVAARTYAWSKVTSGTKTLFPTQVNQNYTGYAKEREDLGYRDNQGRNLRWADAVLSTSGKVLVTTSGSPVATYFTSSMGGHSEDAKYVWGNSSPSYIRAFDDSRWDAASSGSTYRSWARGFTKAYIAGVFGFDKVTLVSVPARGSVARHDGLKIVGIDNGVPTTRYYAGDRVRQRLNLPSPGFTVRTLQAPVDAKAPGRVPTVRAIGGARGGKTTARITWHAPKATGGAAITRYTVKAVRYSSGRVLSTTILTASPTTRAYVVRLPRGWYRFEVRASNAVGAGAWSPRTKPTAVR